jgi:hypothetical protein
MVDVIMAMRLAVDELLIHLDDAARHRQLAGPAVITI